MSRHHSGHHGRHKHKPRRHYTRRPRVSRGLWLIIAILIAGFAVFLLFVTRTPKPVVEPVIVSAPPPINSIKKQSLEKAKPKFEFYNILPQKQIAPQRNTPKEEKEKVSAAPAKPAAPAESKKPAPVAEKPKAKTSETPAAKPSAEPVKKPSIYWVQVGAFLIFSDADSLKAELAMLGFPATIQTATIDGKTWFRVRSGPFDSEEDAQKAQEQLEEADIASKVIPG